MRLRVSQFIDNLKWHKISPSSTPWPAKPARRERKQKQNPRKRKSKKKCEFSRKLSEKGGESSDKGKEIASEDQ
ncbi:Uncharacterized protein TCM_012583 [Theobroma cacao]|uniref:Uncharacterized protein n=1 Tax=Theobroma cacao TaxID=3641 RepID=A0A061G2G8_THECC|nr:Uncharacterized protein TCM_012583 [Theobroma cacao]